MPTDPLQGLSCPVPRSDDSRILLSHGGGGRATQRLLEEVFRPAFANPILATEHDGAIFRASGNRLAMTSDAYVVQPLFFPGGDIGSLAVHGTINDLAMCGAKPLYLTANFILEEGLPIDVLRRVAQSMSLAAKQSRVAVVAGDTKVVERGKADGMYLGMSGIGCIDHDLDIQPASVRAGDAILLSGDLGRHGIAVLAARSGIAFEGAPLSDSAPLAEPVAALIAGGIEVHCLRDLTRGGLAAALVEISRKSGLAVEVVEASIPLEESVRGACELLGLDPLLVANEGRFIAYVPADRADAAVAILSRFSVSADARTIGRVTADGDPLVTMKTTFGSRRIIDLPTGEQLPRIC